jgi:Peptidase M50B-like
MSATLGAALGRIGQIQGHLPGVVAVLLALVAIGAALIPEVWAVTRLLAVVAHEGAHATLASSVGHRIEWIDIKPGGDGETRHSGNAGPLARLSVTFAGYLGPSAFGIGAAELIRVGHIVAVLWLAVLGLLGVLAVLRKVFGFVTVIAALALLLGVAGFASVGLQVVAAYGLAWFLLVSGVHFVRLHGRDAFDAGKLAASTKIPRGFWANAWLIGSVAALVFGAIQLV